MNLHVGHLYSCSDINEAIRKAMSTQYYKNLTYKLVPIGSEGNRVVLRCLVDEYPLSALKVALSYNTFSNASIMLDYQRKNLIGRHSITDAKVSVSKAFRFRLNNRLLWGQKNAYFFDTKYEFSRFDLALGFKNFQSDPYSYHHHDISFAFGYAMSKKADIQVKTGWEIFRLYPDVIGVNTVLDGNINDFYFYFRRRLCTYDRKYLPQKGVMFVADAYCGIAPRYNAKIRGVEADEELFSRVKSKSVYRVTGMLDARQSLTSRLSVGESVGLAVSYGTRAFVHATYVGGPEQFLPSHFTFYGIPTAARCDPSVAMARMSMQYRIVGDLYGSLHVNAAAAFDAIDAYTDRGNDFVVEDWLSGVGATVSYNLSRLPIDLSLMWSKDYKFNVAVNFGFLF